MLTGFAMVLLGVAVGTVGAMMGIGGGMIVVPVFLFVKGFSVQQTVGTAMVIVFFNALSGTLAYVRQKNILYSAAWKFGLATIPGALVGSYVTDYFSGTIFYLTFGTFLVFVSLNMYHKAGKKKSEKPKPLAEIKYRADIGVGSSVIVGFISSALGIGGGIIHVPFMNNVLKFPIHTAVATSTCILCISSFAGFISHGALGHVLWGEAIYVGGGALLGAQLGALVAKRMSPKYLTSFFALFIFGMGLKFIWMGVVKS